MFKNIINELIVTQRNHAHLAANIAMYWGNENFEKPNIPLATIVKGIAFHQNGYELIDTIPIKQMSDEELIIVLKNDFYIIMNDIEAELINMFHQHRLVSGMVKRKNKPAYSELLEEFKDAIQTKLENSKYNRTDFEWANRITHLCDKLSFNFCIGNTKSETISLYNKVGNNFAKNSTHILSEDGTTIVLDPWPFATKEIKSSVVAYESNNYPDELVTHLLMIKIRGK